MSKEDFLEIAGGHIPLTNAYRLYNDLRIQFRTIADEAQGKFCERYLELGSPSAIAKSGYAAGQKIIKKAVQIAVDMLIEKGQHDMTADLFINEYLSPYLTWGAVFSEWEDEYYEIMEQGEEAIEERRIRKETRGRLAGGGFGIGGMAKGIAMASIGNALIGGAHSIANAVGNASTKNDVKNKVAHLYEQGFDTLRGAIFEDVWSIHLALFNVFQSFGLEGSPKFFDSSIRERSERLHQNIQQGKIPKEQVADRLFEIFIGWPYDDRYYFTALRELGDRDGKIESFGSFHGIDVKELKTKIIESKAGNWQKSGRYSETYNTINDLATHLGNEDSSWVKNLLKEIDQKSRTFDDYVYESLEIAHIAEKEKREIISLIQIETNDVATLEEKYNTLAQRNFHYVGAANLISDFKSSIEALNLAQRTYDGHVYLTKASAERAKEETGLIDKTLRDLSPDDINGFRAAVKTLETELQTVISKNGVLNYLNRHIANLEHVEKFFSNYKTDKGQSFYVYPYIDNEKLDEFVKAARELTSVDTLDILIYFDETLFGGGDDGVGITNDRLIITAEKTGSIPLEDIQSVKVIDGVGQEIQISLAANRQVRFKLTQGNKGAIWIGEILQSIIDHRSPEKASRKPTDIVHRRIGFFLGAGILLMPYIFSFLTLRKGYSWTSRLFAMGYLLAVVGMLVAPLL